jgi:O-antigen ligase
LGKLPLRATIAFVVVGIVFYAASGQGIDARLGSTDIAGEERPLVYQLTIRAISDQPLFGTGLGSFEDVFRLYRSAKVLSVYDYAHDTYLETALELGVPSLILLALSIGAAIIECARGVRVRRRDLIYPCIGVGVSGLVWTHALVDFSIQIPAVAVSYAMLMGIAVAQSRSSRE